jgi:hypothetical protein
VVLYGYNSGIIAAMAPHLNHTYRVINNTVIIKLLSRFPGNIIGPYSSCSYYYNTYCAVAVAVQRGSSSAFCWGGGGGGQVVGAKRGGGGCIDMALEYLYYVLCDSSGAM